MNTLLSDVGMGDSRLRGNDVLRDGNDVMGRESPLWRPRSSCAPLLPFVHPDTVVMQRSPKAGTSRTASNVHSWEYVRHDEGSGNGRGES